MCPTLLIGFVTFVFSIFQVGSNTVVTKGFQDILNGTAFVDKSLLIKELFTGSPVKWITAPRHFGKSTNINMVKRFLEIELDESAKPPKNLTLSKNYQLFDTYPLKIFEDKQFVDQHFGKHPVVFIDYKPLMDITSFDQMLRQFANVLKSTFLEHKYLLRVGELWFNDLNKASFQKYIDSELILKIRQIDLETGFTFICTVLHRHFEKKVIVLIDNYESFAEALIFKVVSDTDKIISFFQYVHKELLGSNIYLDRALLTGLHRLDTLGHQTKIPSFGFLHDHSFSKYYGVSQEEVDLILNQTFNIDTEREKVKSTIVEYYGGYYLRDKDNNVYRTGSVAKCLEKKKIVYCSPCRSEYFENLKSMFKSEKIVKHVQHLLQGLTIYGDNCKILTKHDLMTLNDLVKYEKAKSDIDIKLFVIFLCDLGYLTPAMGEPSDCGEIPFKIPNKEMSHELIELLYESSMDKYNFKGRCIQQVHEAVDTFLTRPMNVNSTFHLVCKSLNNLLKYSSYVPQTERDFHSTLYCLLLKKFSPETEIFISISEGQWQSSNPSLMLLLQSQQTVLFVEALIENTGKIQTKEEKQEARENNAQIAESLAFNKSSIDFSWEVGKVAVQNVERKICVGIGVDMDRRISIAYSTALKGSGANRNIKLVSYVV